jgi:acetylornithine deacetylase/succinyl-diaminopimelate desuccinylase-like protein
VTALPVATPRVAPDDEQLRWIETASAKVDESQLRELAVLFASIPSPTGGEAPLAHAISDRLTAAGCEARAQHLDDEQANAIARLRGSGGGIDLLLYAPIDTLTTGDPSFDLPWIGPELRADMRAQAVVDGPFVTGLGASNPKGHAACIAAALEAIRAADLPLRGDLVAGFGAGGMPTNGWGQKVRRDVGHGVGCSYLLEQGVTPDAAVIAKPGWTVSWEEVGLVWIELRVQGTHTYVGSRHRLPYRNAIRDAAALVEALEDWFPEYARRHTDGTVAPQGIVAAIDAGWWHLAAVTPAECRVLVDLRVSPRTTPTDAYRELAVVVDGIADRLGAQITHDLVVAIPGTVSPVDALVTEAAVEAWEAVDGREHVVVRESSGATDANILRSRDIPTVRVGMPKLSEQDLGEPVDFQRGMNTVDVREMLKLTHLLVRVAVNLCSRDRAELVAR